MSHHSRHVTHCVYLVVAEIKCTDVCLCFSHRGASYSTSAAAKRAVVEDDVVARQPVTKNEENGVGHDLMGGSSCKY